MGVLADEAYTQKNLQTVIKNREDTAQKLQEMGFVLTTSKSNFLFAKHPKAKGETLYRSLKERGVLVRHFNKPRISDYIRITVGSAEQMQVLLTQLSEILEELL